MTASKIDATAYLAQGSIVAGDVEIGPNCGIWHNAVLRGDEDAIRIGARTSIQDNATVHVDRGFPVSIGSGCTIGHGAIVHGCTIGDDTLIGMGAIVLDGAVIGDGCIIGAGALVTEGKQVPSGTVWFGNPARQAREMRPEDLAANKRNADIYVELAREARSEALIDALVPEARD